jgi:hypothetical protein
MVKFKINDNLFKRLNNFWKGLTQKEGESEDVRCD